MNNNIHFTEGEINIYCGSNAMSNCSASLEQAAAIARSGRSGKTLYINTFLSMRKLMAAARQVPSLTLDSRGGEGNVILRNIGMGTLASDLWNVERLIKEEKITCVIINSWEFAHQSYLYKERAIFELMGLINRLEVSVLVYSQSKFIQAGKIQRGGLGKLSALASEVIKLENEEVDRRFLSDTGKTPQTDKNVRPTTKKLVERKINDLDSAHSESEVTEGGKLISPEEMVEKVHLKLKVKNNIEELAEV